MSQLLCRLGAVVVLCLLASTASAQLERAERAFADVDLEGTRDAARAALDGGGLTRDDLVRAYRLLGLSQAALGENRAAYESFVRMLALDPEASLERSIAPQLRGPYLEARGYWSARSGNRFSVELVSGPSSVVVRVQDPLGLARTIRLRARVDRDAAYRADAAAAAPEVAFEVEGYEGYAQVVVVAQDEHGNSLVSLGTDVVPVELGERRERTDRSLVQASASSAPRATRILGGVTLGLAAASAALGAAFHIRRQSLADDWNGEGCEQAIGATRADQCGDVRDDLDRAQTLAIVGYALAGVLATTGIVLLTIGGSDEPTRARMDCGITGAGLRCDGRF